MKTHNHRTLILCLITLFNLNPTASADVIPNPGDIPAGQALTVNPSDTLFVEMANGGADLSVWGTLVNQGQIHAMDSDFYGSNIYIGGIFENHGNAFVNGALSILGGSGTSTHKIINHAGGNIVLSGYVDMYSQESQLENAGKFHVIKALGHNAQAYYGFTAGIIRGNIRNTGTFLIDRNNGMNICQNFGKIVIANEGVFEIGKDNICDFGIGTVSTNNLTTYRQTKGETVVNGTFGAHMLELQGGTVSGTGTLLRMPEQFQTAGVNISPGSRGAPFGTLTLVPEANDLIFTFGSINIELGGPNQGHDRVHVNGDLYVVGATIINVTLHGGYVPRRGESFTILSANHIGNHAGGVASRVKLPQLGAGLSWQVVNDGLTVKLNVI